MHETDDATLVRDQPTKTRTAVLSVLIRAAGLGVCLYTTVTAARGWWLVAFVLVDLWAGFTTVMAAVGGYMLVRERRGRQRRGID